MIVVDTSVIASLWVPNDLKELAYEVNSAQVLQLVHPSPSARATCFTQ